MFKNLKHFIRYRKILLSNKLELFNLFNVKIDDIYRLGVNIRIPKDKMDVYNDYKYPVIEINRILDNEIKKFFIKLDRYFLNKNLMEYLEVESTDQIDTDSAIVILKFKLYDIEKFAKRNRFIMILSFLSMLFGWFNLLYLIPGGLIFLIILLINYIIFNKLFV
jgi:hypothetical protein